SVGKRAEIKSTGSLKSNRKLSPIGRGVANGSHMGKGDDKDDEVGSYFREEE
ncbi:hypothetical protein KI387_027112, partial [Taxus chinensis]